MGNLYTLSAYNPAMMLIFLIDSLALCWGKVSNNHVTMNFTQLHYFLSQNVGGHKGYYVSPCAKVGGTCPPVPPLNLIPHAKKEAALGLYLS